MSELETYSEDKHITTKKKKSSPKKSNVKLIESLISPSTNPWSILMKTVPNMRNKIKIFSGKNGMLSRKVIFSLQHFFAPALDVRIFRKDKYTHK